MKFHCNRPPETVQPAHPNLKGTPFWESLEPEILLAEQERFMETETFQENYGIIIRFDVSFVLKERIVVLRHRTFPIFIVFLSPSFEGKYFITFFLLNNTIIAFICSVCLCRDCTINNNKDLQRLLGGGENESKRGIRKMPV